MVNLGNDLLPKTPRYLKVPLIILNSILWLLGLILVIVGGIGVSFFSNFKEFAKESSHYKDALTQITTSAPTGVLVIGILFIFLTVAGCFFAVREKLVGLVVYTILMLVLLVALIGVGGKAITLHNDDIVQAVGSSWEQVSSGPKNATITKLENFLKCCSWSNQPRNHTDLCPKSDNGLPKYLESCDQMVSSKISSNLYLIGVAACSIGVTEFVSVLFSLFLIIRICRSPRSKNYDYQ